MAPIRKRELTTMQKFRQFMRGGLIFIKDCDKPDFKEIFSTLWAVSLGILLLGFIGFTVKLVHIPINNILV